jgi:hypothetical protein
MSNSSSLSGDLNNTAVMGANNTNSSVNSSSSSCIGNVGDNVTIMGNSGMSLNFSDIWLPLYDQANVTLAMVLADLNASSTIIPLTEDFFNNFFGPNGFVTLNTTFSMEHAANQTNGPIDSGLANIVAWLITAVEAEVHQACPTCNFTLAPSLFTNSSSGGSTGGNNNTNGSGGMPPPVNTTNQTNGTNSSTLELWNSGNYSLPANCSYADATNASVVCN